MFAKLKADLMAILERDPAAGGWLSAILLYPSFHIMVAHQLATHYGTSVFAAISRLMVNLRAGSQMVRSTLQPGSAEVFADHGMGIVLGRQLFKVKMLPCTMM